MTNSIKALQDRIYKNANHKIAIKYEIASIEDNLDALRAANHEFEVSITDDLRRLFDAREVDFPHLVVIIATNAFMDALPIDEFIDEHGGETTIFETDTGPIIRDHCRFRFKNAATAVAFKLRFG